MKKGLLIFGIGLVGLLAVMMIVGWEDGSSIARAKAVVQANINDPDSAQFQDLIVIGTGSSRTVCGKVNAKNRFGGYVGYAPFIYREASYSLAIARKDVDRFDIDTACQQAKAAASGRKEDVAKVRPSSSCFGPEDCRKNPDYVSFGAAK